MIDFAITGLGRCRTAWLAAFLTDNDVHCWHEETDLSKVPVPGKISGLANTTLWMFPKALAGLSDKVLVIESDYKRAEDFSKRTYGVQVDLSWTQEYIESCPGAHIHVEDLNDFYVVNQITMYLTDKPADHARFRLFSELKIEVLDPLRLR